MNNHIHTPDDGRGRRDVFVNGRQVHRAFFVDTRRGIVDYFPEPVRIHKHGKRAISRRLRGRVHVELKEPTDG